MPTSNSPSFSAAKVTRCQAHRWAHRYATDHNGAKLGACVEAALELHCRACTDE
jgi:hypothetical protein